MSLGTLSEDKNSCRPKLLIGCVHNFPIFEKDKMWCRESLPWHRLMRGRIGDGRELIASWHVGFTSCYEDNESAALYDLY
jgi:hypothetical protein